MENGSHIKPMENSYSHKESMKEVPAQTRLRSPVSWKKLLRHEKCKMKFADVIS